MHVKGGEQTMIDEYQKSWALRYLREAKAELAAAQKTPALASSLILEAVKKMQTAIYYSLGEPATVEAVIRQTMENGDAIKDPVLKCLAEIERNIEQVLQTPETECERAIEQVNILIQIASDIVELFTGEKA